MSENSESENTIYEEKFKSIEKRFSDYKAYSGFSSLIVAAIIILFGFNYYSQLEDLRDFKSKLFDEIQKTMGTVSSKPNLILCDPNGNDIENGILVCYLDTLRIKEEKQFLNLNFIIKNIGNATSGKIWIKYFSNDPLKMGVLAFEEKGYRWQVISEPQNHSVGEIPGGDYTVRYRIVNTVIGKKIVPKDVYPLMISMYYGNGLRKDITFKVKVVYNENEFIRTLS